MDAVGSPGAPAALGFMFGEKAAFDVCLLKSTLLETVLPSNASSETKRGAAAIFPVKAADLMPEFTGAALGARLKYLESEWIASGFSITRAELLS